MTIDELRSAAAVVRDATEERENTAQRIGQLFLDAINTLSRVATNAIKGYVMIESTEQLPENPDAQQQMTAYLMGSMIYVWVGTGGDTMDGKYQGADLKGPKGDSGVSLGDVVLVDDLTTGGRDKVLSAEQGKELKRLIDNIEIPIVNDLTTGGNESALSAEMGKIIKENVMALLNALGNYAFPEGKPVLDWSPMTAQVILDLNDVSSSNTSKSTTRGRAYTTTLTSSIASNLYIVDATVVMNGVDITSTAYNPNTGVISIAEVTGAIIITASAITYIAAGLQLHLDGKNRGGVTGHWRSLVSAHDYELHNVVEAADGVIFDDTGNSYGTGNAVNVTCDVGTIEVVINSDSVANGGAVFANGIAKGIAFSGWDYGGLKGYVNQTAPSSASIVNPNAAIRTTVSSGYFSLTNASALVNGVQTQVVMGNYPWRTGFTGSSYIGRLASTKFFTGKILAIRIYDRQLSADEMQMNYKIDKQRFGL